MARFRTVRFDLPLKGFSEGLNVADTPASLSNDMGNVRAFDSLSKRFRIGQRPGFKKEFSQQISGAASPIVFLGTVTVVDYLGA